MGGGKIIQPAPVSAIIKRLFRGTESGKYSDWVIRFPLLLVLSSSLSRPEFVFRYITKKG